VKIVNREKMNRQPKILFSTRSYTYLQKKILSHHTLEKGELENTFFPDGENYDRILTEVEGRDVVLLGGTISDSDTLELFDLSCSFVKYGALSLTLVIPYFGYSTMERAVKSGEVVKAKTRAMLFSAIPRSPEGNKIILLDLHTEGIPHYFEGGLRPVHLYCKSLVADAIRKLARTNCVLASTDAGRAKWVESLANDLQMDAAFLFKRRISGDQTEVISINADVKGKDVVIYDDMIRTGGSIVNAAKAYKAAGAEEIFVITTHGLFTNGGMKKIQDSGLIKKVFAADTHPNVEAFSDPFFEVLGVADLIGKNLDKNY
jgi:ribose-phosphate pyrophosphokinase